jgi:succinate dehydrogenase/fumarate reductase-like Fe-S protein
MANGWRHLSWMGQPRTYGCCRVHEFRKCIECFLYHDVCHVLRDHDKHEEFIGPRFFVYSAALEMRPLDTDDRIADMKHKANIGYCNITKCCTRVCPEHIHITDNAISSAERARGRSLLRPGDATASHGHRLVTA